ncbi:hypothetical protein P692DRAFT_20725591 [Suillus brevipes Sb2]|nr:hypothetical protein P692DRAFT_20725591 [Suillus brevipes Sb2]
MEHALHLVAKHFVEEVAPTPVSALHKKAQAHAEDEDEDEESVEFDIGDTIGKALAFVSQVRKSPQARVFLQKCCTEVNERPLELLKWVRTCWASLFNMLERVFQLRKVSSSTSSNYKQPH